MDRRAFLLSSLALAGCSRNDRVLNIVDFGAQPGGGDCSAVLQAALNLSVGKGGLYIPPGTFQVSSTVTIPSGTHLFGEGHASVLQLAAASCLDASNSANAILENFDVKGVATVDTSGAYTVVSNTGTGLKAYNVERLVASRMRFTYLGIGIDYQQSQYVQRHATFAGIEGIYCYKAIVTSNGGEYALIDRPDIDHCLFGIEIGSGNNVINAPRLTQNGIAMNLVAGSNDGHGIVNGGEINHNNYAVQALGVTLGFTFQGVHVLGDVTNFGAKGRIQLISSKGISFDGGQLGCDITQTTPTGYSRVANMLIRDDLGVTVAADHMLIKNNWTMGGGLWSGNN